MQNIFRHFGEVQIGKLGTFDAVLKASELEGIEPFLIQLIAVEDSVKRRAISKYTRGTIINIANCKLLYAIDSVIRRTISKNTGDTRYKHCKLVITCV